MPTIDNFLVEAIGLTLLKNNLDLFFLSQSINYFKK
jgi:hypothetical protein